VAVKVTKERSHLAFWRAKSYLEMLPLSTESRVGSGVLEKSASEDRQRQAGETWPKRREASVSWKGTDRCTAIGVTPQAGRREEALCKLILALSPQMCGRSDQPRGRGSSRMSLL
jgi:hypothetical protein